MGRARVTGDRQREKSEDTPMPRACGCRRRLRPPRALRRSSRCALRAPCSVSFPLSLTLSATLRRRASTRATFSLLFSPSFLSPSSSSRSHYFARAPLPHRVSSFPPASIRFAVVLSSRSLRRAFSLPPLPSLPLIFFPFVFLAARSHLFAPFLPYLFLLLPLPLAVPLPASTSSPRARDRARGTAFSSL